MRLLFPVLCIYIFGLGAWWVFQIYLSARDVLSRDNSVPDEGEEE